MDELKAAEEAAAALEGPNFDNSANVQAEATEPGQVEVVAEGAAVPAYDFGAGELGDKVSKLKEMLKDRLKAGAEAAAEGAENQVTVEDAPKKQLVGADVDWSDFDLDPNYAHLYPRSEFTVTGQGPKWVVVIDEFESFEKPYNGQGVDKKGTPKGLGAFVTSMLNMPPDSGCGPWKLAAFLPATMGNGAVIFQRKVPVILPDPKVLEKETKVEAPTENENAEVDAAAAAWAAEGEDAETAATLEVAEQVMIDNAGALAALAEGHSEDIVEAARDIAAGIIDGPDTE